MTHNILVAGSLAYDNIMTYSGRFSDSILPANIDKLSVSFFASGRSVLFGGTGGNIAYSLSLLGEKPLLLGAGGSDFSDYSAWLSSNSIDTNFVAISKSLPTAGAFVLTDKDDNQITIFSPGAMADTSLAVDFSLKSIENIDVAIISADHPDRMESIALACVRLGVPYLFDPGQGMSSLTKEQLLEISSGAVGLFVNEYEFKLFEEKTEKRISDLGFDFVVETLGKNGARLVTSDGEVVIPAISNDSIVDVTGAGDAFRSGFLYGYVNEFSLKDSVRFGTYVASRALSAIGTQAHELSISDFKSFFSL